MMVKSFAGLLYEWRDSNVHPQYSPAFSHRKSKARVACKVKFIEKKACTLKMRSCYDYYQITRLVHLLKAGCYL